jgi:serine/threonine protein kinase
MPGPGNLRRLKTHEWEKVQALADRWREAWRQGGSPDLVDLGRLAPPEGDPLRAIALRELVATDLEIRWKRGLAVSLEMYLEKLPELGTPRTVSPELIYVEYRVRQKCGDRTPLEKYKVRFPHQYARLRQLVEQQPVPTDPVDGSSPARTPNTSTNATGSVPAPAKPASQGQTLTIGGGYKLLKRIGSGSFGEVWRAEAPGGIAVAVKSISRPLDHAEAQRELQSLELIKQLRHPFLTATQSFGQLEDRLYIVMELADGSLADRVKACRAAGLPGIPQEELLGYFLEAAEALDFLHQNHVQHRDVKPENILLLAGHVKVADFGLAKMMEGARASASATAAGTPMFMAPEVWHSRVSEHSDQYSLACAYAEMRLNHRLFPATDLVGLMYCHTQKVPDLTPLAEAEQQVLHKALAKDPNQRYGSCLEFVRALQQVLEPKPVADQPPRPSRARLWATVAVCVAVVSFSYLAWDRLLRPGSFTLERPSTVMLRADEAVSLQLRIKRDHFQGEVQLAFAHLPDKVTIEPARVIIPARADSVEITLKAEADVEPGAFNVEVRPTRGSALTRLELTVEPLATLPSGYQKMSSEIVTAGATKKKYYKRIQWIAGAAEGIVVEFRVIPQEDKNDPATFYIMTTKVWNRLYARFAKEYADGLDRQWEKGGLANFKPLGIQGHDNWPVLRVPIEDANRCVRWLGGLLPTPQQWDRAAGCFPGQEGPFAGEGPFDPKKDNPPEVAIGRANKGPIDVGTATRDVSVFGCRDMTGNGEEWTRHTVDGDVVPLPRRPERDRVFVQTRSRSYLLDKAPVKFVDREQYHDSGATPSPRDYVFAFPEVSFRVVLEPR